MGNDQLGLAFKMVLQRENVFRIDCVDFDCVLTFAVRCVVSWNTCDVNLNEDPCGHYRWPGLPTLGDRGTLYRELWARNFETVSNSEL